MKPNYFIPSALCFFLAVTPVASATPSSEALSIQHQVFMDELTSYEQRAQRLEMERDSLRERSDQLLIRKQREHPTKWLEILSDATSISDVWTRLATLQQLFDADERLLGELENRERHLQNAIQTIAYKKQFLDSFHSSKGAPSTVPTEQDKAKLLAESTQQWESFQGDRFHDLSNRFLRTLQASSLQRVAEKLEKESLLSYSLTLSEAEINHLLHQDPALASIHVELHPGSLYLIGEFQGTPLFVIGHFERKNANELRFLIDDALLHGLSVPPETLSVWQETHAFSLLPGRLKKGAKIVSCTIGEGDLRMLFSF